MTLQLRSGTWPGMRSPVGMHRERRRQLLDVREWRIAPAHCELRQLRNGDLMATGYASTFDEYEVFGGPENYGWIERIDRKAFDKTLRDKPDVVYLINHAGLPLARTKSGTLKLSVDDGGLKPEALLDPDDPDVQALVPKMERGDVDEMSFAFYVKAQDWSAADGYEDIDDMSYRLIEEVSLHRGDVSVVTFGANPFTSAELALVNQNSGSLSGEPGSKRERIVVGGGPLDQARPVAVERDGVIAVGMTLDEARTNLDAAERQVHKWGGGTARTIALLQPAGGGGAASTGGSPAPAATGTPEGDTIPIADAKAQAGLDMTVATARGRDPEADAKRDASPTLSLADARAQ